MDSLNIFQIITYNVFVKSFLQENKAKFKKGFGVKESSPYNGLIKEKKIKKKVVKKVQAESLRLKMKDIIENAIREHGNPVSSLI